MKPFEELTRLGRKRRMRHMAHCALEAYGLGAARFILTRHAGNTLYRVFSPTHQGLTRTNSLFEPGLFLLRIHWPGYRAESAIQLELEWLLALRKECDLPVPEPVPTLQGDLVNQVSCPGIPEPRSCSLLRWVKGRRVGTRAVSRHYAAQGRLMAQMHNFSQSWLTPEGGRLRKYDWEGLFQKIPALCLPVYDVWSLLPQSYLGPFESVTHKVRTAMDSLGSSPNVFGMIHADLGVDANLLFQRDQPRAIDFDESGLGYWVYDLAVALEHCREQKEFDTFRHALLEAYSELRVLPQEHVCYLDLFMAALDVHIGLWANALAYLRPERSDERRRAKRCLRLVEQYLVEAR
ncbi:phosphotransferase enzyme family protein [candidate division CSSED10-310 bacterium]|uniref:Phosphotransferase enzyme family protein n=1 Tax=candidate division CSSED10-310 bacterium TaxID=2855610 RepID=A0ABV6YSZ1_UNCC1